MEALKPCQFRQVDTHGRILCNLIKGGDREVSVNLCRACPVQAINCQHLRAGLEKQVSTPLTVRFATGRVEVWNDAPTTIEFKQAACAAKTMPIHSPRDCAGCPLRVPNVIPQNAIQVARQTKPNAPAVLTTAQMSAPAQANAPRAKRNAVPAAAPAAQPTRAEAKRNAPAKTNAPATAQNNFAESNALPAPNPFAADNSGATHTELSPAATDLVARAQATAKKKAAEQEAIAREAQRIAAEQKTLYASTAEPKSKIIQIQAWLAGQVSRKQANKPLAVTPDADGVSEIVYAPLAAQSAQVYQETVDYERCVGWTD